MCRSVYLRLRYTLPPSGEKWKRISKSSDADLRKLNFQLLTVLLVLY